MRTATTASLLILALISSHGACAGPLAAEVTRRVQDNLPEFLELLSIPNVADRQADIERNAAFLSDAFERRGFEVLIIDNPARRPAVLAQLDGGGRDRKSVV